jgi:hypothetical protein
MSQDTDGLLAILNSHDALVKTGDCAPGWAFRREVGHGNLTGSQRIFGHPETGLSGFCAAAIGLIVGYQ